MSTTHPDPVDLQEPEAVSAPTLPRRRVVGDAADACRRHLLGLQAEDGSWCGELEGDTILESEYVLAMHFLGRSGEPKIAKAAEYLRRKQLPEGGWAIYQGGPPEPSASVKAYFVLKLLGDDPGAPHMSRARRVILELGGIEACNSFTKIYLSIFGQYDWEEAPAVPPEMILLPTWFPFNIYEMSSWSRAIVVPLSIIWAHKPRCAVPAHADISELTHGSLRGAADITKFTGKRTAWTRLFSGLDVLLKLAEKSPRKPLRQRAIEKAESWILERLVKSDGLAAIFPPIVNTIIAFRCLGYALDHPVLAGQVRELERLEIEDEETLRVQPCFSALWDTAQVVNALLESDLPPGHPAVLSASRWLIGREVKTKGDWSVKLPDVEPGGWYFEYANEFYPDCDDTAEVLLALAKVRFPDPAADASRRAAVERGLKWLLAMQNRDGGWAGFDKDCAQEFLVHVPFADHNAMLDPSCEDITARVLEALRGLGFDRRHGPVRAAIDYLFSKQEADGSWYGRWGCNYLYGTWLALVGLTAVGVAPEDPRLERAAAWLRAVQNPDGGWGELPLSYDDPSTKGQGPSTAAQTSWALLGLLAVGETDTDTVLRGIHFLLDAQRGDGSFCDEPWTGTGFPRVFYLRYHLYATQFPLIALATWLRRTDGAR